MKCVRMETAGRLVRGMICTRALPSDPEKIRQAKKRCSSAAREAMNLRYAWQKLEVQLAANYGPEDMVVTLTYRDSCLPWSRENAMEQMRKFIRRLRKCRRDRGETLRYLYCTEGYHQGGRWHHHMVVNSTGNDYDEIRRLWSINGDDVDFQHIDLKSYEEWARYLTKEPREHGRPRVGDRIITPAHNLYKPLVERASVPDAFSLVVPRGAVVLEQRENRNCYGEYVYIKYLLPCGAAPESLGGA